jgi:hypothetical protein
LGRRILSHLRPLLFLLIFPFIYSLFLCVSPVDSVLRRQVQFRCKLQRLVILTPAAVDADGREVALLAAMLGDTLALHQLAHAFTVSLVQLEVMLHLCNLDARLQIEDARGNFQVFSFYTLVFKLSCVEMQTF